MASGLADVYSRLLEDRIVFLGTAIDDQIADVVVAQLLHLEAEDPGKDIALYINSPGGDMTGLFAIYDTMQFIASGRGDDLRRPGPARRGRRSCRRGAGKRAVLPNSRVLIHQPHGGAQGQSTDLEMAREMVDMRERMVQILVAPPGKSSGSRPTSIATTSCEARAVAYGLVDEVFREPSVLPGATRPSGRRRRCAARLLAVRVAAQRCRRGVARR